jgi:hypothetical protein
MTPAILFVPPTLRVVRPFRAGKPHEQEPQTDRADGSVGYRVSAVDQNPAALPDLRRGIAGASGVMAGGAHAAVLKFARAAGYPNASDKAAKLIRAGLRVVSER